MSKVVFMQGNKAGLPTTGVNNATLYFVNDTEELYKSVGDGLPLAKMSEVRVVSTLPTENIIDEKLYVVSSGEDLELFAYVDGAWKTIAASGSPVADDRVDILFNLKNKQDVLTYDGEGNIVKLETTGEVDEEINYAYDNRGNIMTETILRQGYKVVNTFGYDEQDNIVQIDTNVTEIE